LPFRYIAAIPTLLTGPGLTTVILSVCLVLLYTADTICSVGLFDVDARSVVYIHHPTATAITIIIASSIASSIDVRPFIGVEYLLNYKFCVAPRRINGGGSRRTGPFSTGRLGLSTRFRPARRVGPFGSACRRRRRRLSASSMRPEALCDAVTRAARRRRPLDCPRRAAPLGWASPWRAGRRPCVSGRHFVMSTGGDVGGLSSRSRSSTSTRAGVLEAPGLWRFGPAWRGDPRPCTDGGGVERLAIYCTLYKYFGEGWRWGCRRRLVYTLVSWKSFTDTA